MVRKYIKLCSSRKQVIYTGWIGAVNFLLILVELLVENLVMNRVGCFVGK